MKKIIEEGNQCLDSIKEDFKNKRIFQGILKSILITIALICTGISLGWVILLIYNNISYIIIVIGGICCLIAFFRSLMPAKYPQQETMVQQQIQPANNNFMQYDPITLANTYQLIRSNLCIVLGEICDLIKVRKPASYSQLDAPTNYDIVANVPIYHYLVPKQGAEIDIYTAMGILQNAIEQKLNNNELPGISQAVFFYKGQAFPALMVNNLIDCGGFIQIDMAVASEYYCRYREQRLYNNMNQTNGINPSDYDF